MKAMLREMRELAFQTGQPWGKTAALEELRDFVLKATEVALPGETWVIEHENNPIIATLGHSGWHYVDSDGNHRTIDIAETDDGLGQYRVQGVNFLVRIEAEDILQAAEEEPGANPNPAAGAFHNRILKGVWVADAETSDTEQDTE